MLTGTTCPHARPSAELCPHCLGQIAYAGTPPSEMIMVRVPDDTAAKNHEAISKLLALGMKLLDSSRFLLDVACDLHAGRRDYTAHSRSSVAEELRRRGSELARQAEYLP